MRKTESGPEDEQRIDPNNPMEKEILSQIQQIKNRAASRPAVKADTDFAPAQAPKKPAPKMEAPATGEIEFADEPPFQDDLPF